MKPCPYCGSEDIRKSGTLKSGSQRYVCNSCKKCYSEHTIIREPLQLECPFCGGKLRLRGHNKSGTQRYKCTVCGKSCCETTLKPKIIDYNKNKECPYCHSKNTKKGGVLKYGNQRYVCNDCNKHFSDTTIVKIKEKIYCTKCNSTNVVKSGSEHGKQRYLCKDCKSKFVLNPSIKQAEKVKITCPICGNNEAIKAGTSKDKRKYFICTKCEHKFTDEPIFRQLTKEVINKIISLHEQKIPNTEIAKKLNISIKTVYNHLKPIKEKIRKENLLLEREIERSKEIQKKLLENKETKPIIEKQKEEKPKLDINQIKAIVISGILKGQKYDLYIDRFNLTSKQIDEWLLPYYEQEHLSVIQKQLIYKFGVLLDTPAVYVATYVPCSLKIRKEFIDKQEKPAKVKYERNKADIAIDKMELDRFIHS